MIRKVFSNSAPLFIVFLGMCSILPPFLITYLRVLWTFRPILTWSILFSTTPIRLITTWRSFSTCRPILIRSVYCSTTSSHSIAHLRWKPTHSWRSFISIFGLMGPIKRTRGRGTRRDISDTENSAKGAYRSRVAIGRVDFFGIG